VAKIVANVVGKDPADIPPGEFREIVRDLRRGNGKIKIEK